MSECVSTTMATCAEGTQELKTPQAPPHTAHAFFAPVGISPQGLDCPTSLSNGCGSCLAQAPPHTAHAFFTPQALWLCTNLKTGMEFEVSGPLASHYLGQDEIAQGIRTLIEKRVSDYFIKDGLHVKCVSQSKPNGGDEPSVA